MTSDQEPGQASAGRPHPSDEFTVRQGGTPAIGNDTLRLRPTAEPADEATRPTLLDPDAWRSTLEFPAEETAETVPQQPDADGAVTEAAPGTTGLRRFGPGVPTPTGSAGTGQAAAVWHGTVSPGESAGPGVPGRKHRSRALRGWSLPIVVVLAVLAYLAWQRYPRPVHVTGLDVRADAASWGCGATARVVGTVRTDGGAGTIRYRWRRSDGTTSDELREEVPRGTRQTQVVLLWTLTGPGSLTATATLTVLAPQEQSATAGFRYLCTGHDAAAAR